MYNLKSTLIKSLLFLGCYFYSLPDYAQYNFKIDNRPDIYNYVGFNCGEGYQLGDYLYLHTREQNVLRIMDVSTPEEPQCIKVLSGAELFLCKGKVVTILYPDETCLDVTDPYNIQPFDCRSRWTCSYDMPYEAKLEKSVIRFSHRRDKNKSTQITLSEAIYEKGYSPTIYALDENRAVLHFNNLYFIEVNDEQLPQIVGTYCFEEKTKYIELLSINYHSILIKNKDKITKLDISDLSNPKMEMRIKLPNFSHLPALRVLERGEELIYLIIGEEGGCFLSSNTLIRLRKNGQNNKWTDEIIHSTYAHEIHFMNPVSYIENEAESPVFFHDFDALFYIGKNDVKPKPVLFQSGGYGSFDISKDFVITCMRNELSSKFCLFQNNENGTFHLLSNVFGEELRQTESVAFNKGYVVLGGGRLPEARGGDFTIYDINNPVKPKMIYDSRGKLKGNKIEHERTLQYVSFVDMNFMDDFLFASAFNVKVEPIFITYDLTNITQPIEINIQKRDREFQTLKINDEWFYFSLTKERVTDNYRADSIMFAYPVISEAFTGIKEFRYYPERGNSHLSVYEKSLFDKLKLIIDITSKERRFPDRTEYMADYKYGFGKYIFRDGFIYKLNLQGGIEVYQK